MVTGLLCRYRAYLLFLMFIAIPYRSNASIASLPQISKLDYSDPLLKKQRAEVTGNLKALRSGKKIQVRFRRYRIKKTDNFFSVMARTMLNHDTLSSINRLASLYDIHSGETWLIPNSRGIAVYGSLADIQKKYKRYLNNITAVPGRKGMYFIAGAKFPADERKFFSLKAFIRPVGGRISSNYGYRSDPFNNKKSFHSGLDIACPMNSKVKASASGKIIFAGTRGGYGKAVIIEHKNGYRTLYGHLNKIKVKKGQFVKQAQVIALSGKTGRATGPHLHFEVLRKGKPMKPHFGRSMRLQ